MNEQSGLARWLANESFNFFTDEKMQHLPEGVIFQYNCNVC